MFLQHGVIGRKNVEYHKSDYITPFELFIVSSDPEKHEVVMDKLGYENEEAAVTGLARFNNLYRTAGAKDILLMPTWRDWTNTEQCFPESEYYRRYASLIQNERLLQLLDAYDVNLHFYPHYRVQDYFRKNIQSTSNRVQFIQLGEKTVQDLLIDHALLITDYSSVSFDFMIMEKPVIYYQFDVKAFFKRGILRALEEACIGETTSAETDLIDLIADRIKQGFENYAVDTSGILKFHDHDNCRRIYEAVQERLP